MIGFLLLTLLGLGFALGGFSGDDDKDDDTAESPNPDRTTYDVVDGETVTGTEARETFNLIGAGTAYGAGGGDIFNLDAQGAEAHGGAGNDSFSLSGNATGIGGLGDDRFSYAHGNTVSRGGAGDDFYTSVGGNALADGGPGDDMFNSVTGTATVLGGAGNDVFGVETNAEATIDCGNGGDLFLYANPSPFYDETAQGSTVTGGDGADVFATRMFDQVENNDVVAPHVITDFDPAEDILGVIPPPSGNTQLDSVDVMPAADGSYTDVRLNFLDDTQSTAVETSQLFRLLGQPDFDPALIRVLPNLGGNTYDCSYQDILGTAA